MNKERKAKKAIELGKYYTKRKNDEKGLMYFLKGVSTFHTKISKMGENYLSIALIYEKLGQKEKAEKYMKMSKSVYRYKKSETQGGTNKYNSESQSDKREKEGYKFLETQNFKKALNKFLLALNEADLGSGTKFKETLYHDIAYCYENLGNYEKAYQYIQECLRIAPGYLDGKRYLGNLLIGMGKQEEGEKILTECEKLEKDIQEMPLDLDTFYNSKIA